jgi:hypothetical protein
VITDAGELGREVSIECGSLVAEYRGRKRGCRLDEPGQLRQDPAMPYGELMESVQLESGVGQYLGSGSALPRRWS